jgi:hypothetical protein
MASDRAWRDIRALRADPPELADIDEGEPAVLAQQDVWVLPPSGLLQVRLVGAGQPVRILQTRVDRFLSSP